jgi:16S rRNA (cytosine1407-C5)-methyltransferase
VYSKDARLEVDFWKPLDIFLSMKNRFFQEWMGFRKDLFTPTEFRQLERAFNNPRHSSIRSNALNPIEPKSFEKYLKRGKLQQVLWSKHGYYFSDPTITEQSFYDLSEFSEGKFTFQTLSSQLPPIALGVKPGDLVLDMCAAPGSKTVQLLEVMEGAGTIHANDIDRRRVFKLESNIKRMVKQGLVINVTNQDGRKLDTRFGQPFDCILLDAPCSGEGTFHRSDPLSYKYWTPSLVFRLAKLQRQLLSRARSLLRPGGFMVYSTCTLGLEENEDNVRWFLQEYADMNLIELNQLESYRDRIPEFQPSKTHLPHVLRILSSEKYEGFFICRFQRSS